MHYVVCVCLRLVSLVCVSSLGDERPSLPEGYTDFILSKDLVEFKFIDRVIENGTPLTEDSILPYEITIPSPLEFCWGEKDSFSGAITYTTCIKSKYEYWAGPDTFPYETIMLLWQPHQVDNPPDDSIESSLDLGLGLISSALTDLSLDEQGPQKITISGNQAYRLRGFYLIGGSCGARRYLGAFTTYFILAQPYDYIIVCSNDIYRMESPEVIPDSVYDYPEEIRDSVIANWEHEKTYPNNIAELEQAVEQTFRVKE
jgi:hypothetical protein